MVEFEPGQYPSRKPSGKKAVMRALLISLLIVVGSGCSKPKPFGPVTPQQALEMLPADSQFVLGVNFDQFRSSDFFKKIEPTLVRGLGESSDWQDFKAECGIDPLTNAANVWVGGTSTDSFVTVIQGFSKEKVYECAKKSEDSRIEGQYIHTKDGAVATFVGPRTVVLASEGKPALLSAIKGGGFGSSTNYTSIKSKVATSSDIWLATTQIPTEVTKDLPISVDLEALYFSASTKEKLLANLSFVLKDKNQAFMITTVLKMGIANLGNDIPQVLLDLLKKVTISANENAVDLNLELSTQSAADAFDTINDILSSMD